MKSFDVVVVKADGNRVSAFSQFLHADDIDSALQTAMESHPDASSIGVMSVDWQLRRGAVCIGERRVWMKEDTVGV